MHRRLRAVGTTAAALACLTFAASASAADPTSFSGSVRNGGCDANQRVVAVSGPSRIEAEVASTSAANTAYADILGPNGAVLASGSFASYDTTTGGEYSIRICTWYSHIDPPTLRYSATSATGAAGQPALPRQHAVLSANATITRAVNGTGAIRSAKGLAYFTIKTKANGAAVVRVYSPRTNKHYLFSNAGVRFLTNGVSLSQGRMTMRLVQSSSGTRIVYSSPQFKATGTVVRGSYLIV
jgi:hypothetical protein